MQKAAGQKTNGWTPLDKGWSQLRRLGRQMLWHDPALYRWVGRLRGRGDCLATNFDVWMDGFPGSASALAAATFQKANPEVRVAPRRHLPPFILNALYQFKPGMLLVSPPEEAVVSWAVLSGQPVGKCLDYYLDFHWKLRPNAPWFLVVTPGELMTKFDMVMEVFNLHFQTNYAAPAGNLMNMLFSTDSPRTQPDSPAGELRIVRPPDKASGARKEARQQLQATPALRRKLDAARELYVAFVPGNRRAPVPPLNVTTRHLPTMA